jgi:Mn2+/Fe2+ NRAMP family transporter
LLNALTIVTEFIGISLALGFLGVSKPLGVIIAALLIMVAAGTGNFRRFERFSLFLVVGSLLLVPVFMMVHPPVGQMLGDFLVPRLPQKSFQGGRLSEVMLLIIAIVGTTVAPWQLFFQQSYVIDKRISPRFIPYERADLWIGIVFVTVGAVALMAIAAATFTGHPEFGAFSDARGVASGLEKYAGLVPAVLFALALIDACIIGAAAVSLSTAYAIGDVVDLRHSLHRKPAEAKAFYSVYCGLIAVAAALVLTPGTPLGLLTNAVQTLAGVLLPSATVFLLLLCNDRAVLGPWANTRGLNLFTGAVIAVLVMLSIILTASVLDPEISGETIVAVLVGGSLAALVIYLTFGGIRPSVEAAVERHGRPLRNTWRMPPLAELPLRQLTTLNRVWLFVLRAYLIVAAGLVLLRIFTLATGGT